VSILFIIGGWILGGLVVGFLLLPALAFLLGKSMALVTFSRILFTIQQLATGGTVLNERGDGNGYEQRVVEDRDGEAHMFTRTGDWEAIPNADWYRLGKKRFGITFDKPSNRLQQLETDPEDSDDLGVMPDGGMIFPDRRAGFREWTPFTGSEDGFVCTLSQVVDRLHGRGGTEGSKVAKDVALAKYGGDNDIANKVIIAGGLAFFIAGALMAFFMFGL
jgi:hypothetical protein